MGFQDLIDDGAVIGAIIGALGTALVAFVVLVIERLMARRDRREELRRRGLESALSSLGRWVDEHRDKTREEASLSLLRNYQSLTNRQILELGFRRRERYVAWWIHEMVMSIYEGPEDPDAEWGRDKVLRATGESLLEWHHGKLSAGDFKIPYALRASARDQGISPEALSETLGISSFLEPKRPSVRKEIEIIRALSRPDVGLDILKSLKRFVSLRRVAVGASLAVFKLFGYLVVYFANKVKLKRNEMKLKKNRERIRDIAIKFEDIDSDITGAREELSRLRARMNDAMSDRN